MSKKFSRRRRHFLQISAAVSGGLVVGVFGLNKWYKEDWHDLIPGKEVFMPNAWIQISRDNTIKFFIDKSEMGQGIATGLAMLIAEELEVDINSIMTEFAPAHPIYANPSFGIQATGNSTSIRTSFEPLRQMGATTRELLLAAAAKLWNVPKKECMALAGQIIHKNTQNKLSYGDLIDAALNLPIPERVILKKNHFKLLGKPIPRLDSLPKADGSALFGSDIRIPHMLIATVVHPPVFGARLAHLNKKPALALPGVVSIVELPQGVAVVADTFWHAKQAADSLDIQWEENASSTPINDEFIRQQWLKLIEKKGDIVREEGKIDDAFTKENRILEAHYFLPYQAHVTMEPMNCTADITADSCNVWVGTQSQAAVREIAAHISGLPYEKVKVHTTFLGGGFGRRSEVDFVAEALLLSKIMKKPIKLLWTREEDIQHDFYRPASFHHLKAALTPNGLLEAWFHRLICPSILSRVIPEYVGLGLPRWLPLSAKSIFQWTAKLVSGFGGDGTATEGAVNNPYDVKNMRVEYLKNDPGIPVGFWRSVGNSHNAFAVECFIDEIAQTLQQDPLVLRQNLLKHQPRHAAVLKELATRSNWYSPPNKGIFRGVAIHACYDSIVGQVVEISMDLHRGIIVQRVVCVVDCGFVINPNLIAAQMESGIAFGLSATLFGGITLENGRVKESNFHDFPVVRMRDMPQVETFIMENSFPPGGIGEAGVPPIAPAVANAIYAATGKRIRHLPIRYEDLFAKRQ